MDDNMYFGNDNASLRRGKRRAPRTETCRPCLLWLVEVPDVIYQGVAIDVNPYGMLVRMMDSVPKGAEIEIQLMRDENFQQALTAPLPGLVVRTREEVEGFVDHGVQLDREELVPRSEPIVRMERKRKTPERPPARMHTIDIQIGDSGTRRTGR